MGRRKLLFTISLSSSISYYNSSFPRLQRIYLVQLDLRDASISPFIQITLSRSLSSRFQNGPDILQGGGQAGAGNEAEKSETMKKPTRRPGVKPPPDRAKRSIFLFKLKNPIRQFCITVSNGIQTLKFSPIFPPPQITEAKWFEIFILLAITGTCVSLAVRTFFLLFYC